MSFKFSPDYFQRSRTLFSDSSAQNCISLFCQFSDDNSNLFMYDFKLVQELLAKNPQCSDMEFLSIIFDFNDILTRIVDDQHPILALKKLTAISFFFIQLVKQSKSFCLEEIENLFQISRQLFLSKKIEIVNIASQTFSFALNVLSSKCRHLNALIDNMDPFFNIVRFIIDFFINQKMFNQFLLSPIISFLLNSIYCFSPQMELDDKIHHLLVDIIKTISSYSQSIPSDFNYLSLLDKIFSFLEEKSVFPKKTKIFLFSFILNLILRKPELIDFLFDDLYLDKTARFINNVIDSVKVSTQPSPIKIYKNLPKEDISLNTVVNNTFSEELSIEEPKVEEPNNEIQEAPFTPKNKDTISILNTYNRICKASPARYFALMSKTMYAILHLDEELPLPVHFFLVYCFNSMIIEDPDKAIDTLKPSSFHLILQLDVFRSGIVNDLSLNIANSLSYLARNCSTALFMQDVIWKFFNDCKTLTITDRFAEEIVKYFLICGDKFYSLLEAFKFDEIISNLMIDLRSFHVAAKDDETINAIIHARTVLFKFILMLFHIKNIKESLVSSEKFIGTLCQMMFEKNLVNYVISLLSQILVSSKTINENFQSILAFIQGIFDRKTENLGFVDISRQIINSLVIQFRQYPTEMSIIFFHSKLLNHFLNFVLYTNEREDLYSLFMLFQNFSKFQELVKDYILSIAPFTKLQPLVGDEIDDDIKDWLWSYICGESCKYLDKVRPIKNGLPLSLLFHSLEQDKNKLLDFIVCLRKCCEADQLSAIEVCCGDIPSLLIEQILKYRQLEEGDSLFEEVTQMLTTLSYYSMKSKDLLSLFQAMTLINGQKRPFYTQDLLKLLQNIFGMKLEMPCAFISSSGRSSLFKVKETKLLNSFTDFTIFFEFKPVTENWKPKSELLRIATEDNTLLLWFKLDQLYLTFLNKEEPLEFAIDVKFPLNSWTQLAFVFCESTLSFYMNSVLIFNVKAPKFIFKDKINSCSFARSFSCNLSSFILANTALDSKCIKYLYYLPKYAATTFDITEIDNFPRIFQPLFTSSLSSNSIYIFNALVTHNRKLPNLSIPYIKYEADFIGRAYKFSPQPKQILRCIGGISTIYPLFSQFTQPFSNSLLSNLLAFVTTLFNNCILNQEEFYYSNSFQIISCLLSSKITDVDDDIISRISEMYESINMRLLIRQMFVDFLFNVRLWIYLPIEKQDKLYKSFIKLFMNSSLTIKKVTSYQLTFRYILMLIKVFLWSVNTNTNTNRICLLDKKIDHKSEKNENTRPSDLSIVRANLLYLAELIEPISFTGNDAETLIYYSLDSSDPALCSEFLALLNKLLPNKNQVLIQVLNKGFTYKDFFPLISSDNEKVRANALNLLILFSQNDDLVKFLAPYSLSNWIDGITRFINLKYTSSYFADVVLSHIFGYYKKGSSIDTYIKYSESAEQAVERILIDKLIPIMMLTISKLPEKIGKIYTFEINKSVKSKKTQLIKTKCWDHPFILYILSRLTVRKRALSKNTPKKASPSDKPRRASKGAIKTNNNSDNNSHKNKVIHADETTMDESGRDILLSLSYLYIDSCKIESVRYLLHVLSIMLKRDVYFLIEAIIFSIMNHSLLTGKFKEESVWIFASFIFEYIFILPDIDSYAPLSFESNTVDKCLSLPSNLKSASNTESGFLSPRIPNRNKSRTIYGNSLSSLAASSNLSKLANSSSNASSTSASTSEDKINNINNNNDNNNNDKVEMSINDVFIIKRSFAREKYQHLYNLKMKCEKAQLKYIYSIRIDPLTRVWIDDKLAENFCKLFSLYSSLTNDEYSLFYLAFTVSIGIQNPKTFSTFYPFCHTVKSSIPLKGHLNEMKTKIFICYLAGMSKIYYNTSSIHESHRILYEDLKVFNMTILDVFKITPNSFNSFEEFENYYLQSDKKSENNILLLSIEKFSNEVELSFMNNLASQVSKSTTKDYLHYLETRNQTVKSDDLTSEIHQNPQIAMQLQGFASTMKNAQTKGLKKYIESWRIMSSEKGPWCPPEKSFNHHWRLEKSHQKIMRRGLMKENFTFTNHSEAATLRDTSKKNENEFGISNGKENEENYKSIMKMLRITDFIGDRNVETLFQDNEISSINEIDGIQIQPDDIMIKVDAKLITMKDVSSGSFSLTSELLIFDSPSKYFDLSLDQIQYVFKRKYLVQNTSLEIFTTMHRAYFFEFVGDQREKIIRELLRIKPKNLKYVQDTDESIKKLIQKTTNLWQMGKISNFDYLMYINMYSGRTYNDLGQYPIFPWVISNYSSNSLDLKDPSNYRDLTKPLGALSEDRLRLLKEKYNETESMDMPYLYGSFYSSSAVVIGYLIRVEPFTSLHIKLQSGKFDLPDRLFNSIPKAWDSVTTTMMDFRELIPEFYYLPDFLVNSNNFDLGISISMAKSYNISTTSMNSKNCGSQNNGDCSSFEPVIFPNPQFSLNKFSNERKIKSLNTNMKNWKAYNNFGPIDMNSRDNNFSSHKEDTINVNYCNNIRYCDVELPPWAKSPLDFIRKNRAALESPIVSANLPFWIDMIFGITSRGEKAFRIDNVFHPFFFVEEQNEHDPDITLKKEYTACFGQAPIQIFEKNHPSKIVFNRAIKIHEPQLVFDCKGKSILSIEADEYGFITVVNSDLNIISTRNNKVRPLFPLNSAISPDEINICSKLVQTKGRIALLTVPWDPCLFVTDINEGILYIKRFHLNKISAVSITENRYVTASLDGTVALWKKPNWSFDPPPPTTKSAANASVAASSSSPVLQTPSSPSSLLSNLVPNISLTANVSANVNQSSSLAGIAGSYTNVSPSNEAPQVESNSEVQANDSQSNPLVSESDKSKEPKLQQQQLNSEFGQIPIATITKHNSPVSAVAINETANILVSGARDGTLVTSSLMSGRVIKMIKITNTMEPINYYIKNKIDVNHITSNLKFEMKSGIKETGFDSADNSLDANSETLNEYCIAADNIDDLNVITVSQTGTICVGISRPTNSIVKIYDINLNEICCCSFDSYIKCLKVFEWYNGTELLVVALRNKKIELVKIPGFKHIWTFNGYDTTFIEIAKKPLMSLLVGTVDGKVFKIDLEVLIEKSFSDDSLGSNNINIP